MLDGAGPVRRFVSITLPMISGALFFTVITHTIAALQMFDQAYTMFYGPQQKATASDESLVYMVYLFQNAFQFFKMGFASAMAWLLFVIILVITVDPGAGRQPLRLLRRRVDAMSLSTVRTVSGGARAAPAGTAGAAGDVGTCRPRAAARGAVRPVGRLAARWLLLFVATRRVRLSAGVAGQRVAEAQVAGVRQPARPRDRAVVATSSTVWAAGPVLRWLLNSVVVALMAADDRDALERPGGVRLRLLPVPAAAGCCSAWCWRR